MDETLKSKFITVLKIFIPLGIGIYLLWYFYSAMDSSTKEVFYRAIREANYFWIALSMFIGLISHITRAHRWKYLLEPLGYTPKLLHRYHAVMVGYLINLLFPRAGEVSRATVLYQTDKIPFSKSFGTILAERVLDTLMLGIIVLFAFFISFSDLLAVKDIIISGAEQGEEGSKVTWVLYIIIILIVLTILGVFVFWLKSKKFKEKVNSFAQGLIKGTLSIFKSKKPFHFLFYTFLIWLLYIIFFGICFLAFKETQHFPIEGIIIGFIAGTLGMAFTNGGIGAYPYLVSIVVIFFMDKQHGIGDAEGIGKALGMIIWLSQTVLMLILGLISLILLPRNFKKNKNDKVGTNTA